ncbi:MAG: CHAT domain-containing protein [Saprospiraceae bacterium]
MRKYTSFLIFLPLLFTALHLHSQTPCDSVKISGMLTNSTALLDEGHYQAALDVALSGLKMLENCPEKTGFHEAMLLQTDDCYQALAADLLQRGLFNRSIDMSERSIALHRQLQGEQTDRMAKAYLVLGGAQNLNGNPKLAIESGNKGLKIRQLANPSDLKIANHFDQIANYYLALEDTTSTRILLQEWDAFHRLVGSKASMQSRINLANYWSTYYELKGELRKGIKILEDTLTRYGEALRNKGGFVGIVEFRLCELYAQVGDYKKSHQYADKNIAMFETRLKQQRGKLFTRTHYAWCLAQASRAAWKQYTVSKDTAWYNLAERRCREGEDLVFAMRDRAPNDGFRDWIANEVGIVANLAEVRQGLYAQTGDQIHIDRAFESIEASKSFAVQEFLHETYSLQWGGLPDSLYQRELAFRQEVNDLETNFFMMRSRKNADSLIAANDQALFTVRDQYRVFLADLEKTQPEYFRLKYSQPKASIRQVQTQTLRPNQCLLDIFIENSLVFTLLVRPDTVVWLASPFDSLFEVALQTLEHESRHFPEYLDLPEKEYLQRLQSFAEASHLVYKKLIAPLRPLLLEEVLLIPRNELANVPFGALLTQRETNIGRPFLWHYLDNELIISQAYSVGLFQFVQNRPIAKKPSGSVLALAPFFEGKISEELEMPVGDVAALTRAEIFKPLPGSGAEALSIAQLTSGQSIVGTNATKANFLKKCQDFNILHLATHSAANDVLGEYSFVALHAENLNQKIDLLYARDIYGLRLSADLVVLSACETALGQYRNDEGVVGLTRAFTCAGARNVVASLWSVNDASTQRLMVLFYQEINKGIPYNRALANAKRTFIKENRQYAHPYYWAGFILNGR